MATKTDLKKTDFQRGYDKAAARHVFNLLMAFFPAIQVDLALRKREASLRRTEQKNGWPEGLLSRAGRVQKAKSKSAAAGGGK